MSARAQSFERLLDAVTEIVERDFRIIIDRDTFEYARFATHVQYLFKRIQGDESLTSENLQLYKSSRKEFPELARCVDHISEYMEHAWGTKILDEEKLYIMLHVNRVCSQGKDQGK